MVSNTHSDYFETDEILHTHMSTIGLTHFKVSRACYCKWQKQSIQLQEAQKKSPQINVTGY